MKDRMTRLLGPLDDNWTVTVNNDPGHMWVEMKSLNPKAQPLKLDPWRDEIDYLNLRQKRF